MFKELANLARLSFTLTPRGPILIKAGESLDPTEPDMAFVRLWTPAGRTVCIPGSSLKGVVRSAAEALLRTVDPTICDGSRAQTLCPGKEENESRKVNGKLPYDAHCRVCQTFGSTELASRVRFSDLLPWPPDVTVEEQVRAREEIERYINVRMNVSIDRRKSAVAQGPFEMETLSGGTLYGEGLLHNYRLWQAGLIFFLFDQLDQGLFRLGFAKSRGLGRVRLQATELVVDQFGPLAQGGRPVLREPDGSPRELPVDVQPIDQPLGQRFIFKEESLSRVKRELLRITVEEFESPANPT